MHVKNWILTALLSVLIPSALFSQDFPVEEPDGIFSPEFTGNKVVFRLFADAATEVFIDGSWLDSPRLMQKMPGGVWEYHTFGLKPDMYSYSFIVDGVAAADPNNPLSYRDGARMENYFFVNGHAIERYRAVPDAGTVVRTSFHSNAFRSERDLAVYLPAEYGSNPRKEYPVLYLLHGEGGDEDSWIYAGKAPQILDYLIGSGKALPMIVVMPDCSGNVSGSIMMSSIVNEVVPFVESHFRAAPSETRRGIAGIGAGGRLAIRSSVLYLNRFDYICALSCGVEDNGHLVDDFLKVKQSKVRLFWVGCGRMDDVAYESSKLLHDTLSYVHLDHTFYLSHGGHSWSNWRQYLFTFVPLIFKYYTD